MDGVFFAASCLDAIGDYSCTLCSSGSPWLWVGEAVGEPRGVSLIGSTNGSRVSRTIGCSIIMLMS